MLYWAQAAVCTHDIDVWDSLYTVLYLGRASRTKETLHDFIEKCRVTRHSLVFRGLTGSQRTPRFWGVTCWATDWYATKFHFVHNTASLTLIGIPIFL